MARRSCQRLVSLGLVTLGVSACNFPRFQPSVQPLEMPTFPAPPSLGPVGGADTPIPAVPSQPGTPPPLETPAFEPEMMLLCTTDVVRLRAGPSLGEAELSLIPAGFTVTRLSSEAPEVDGHTWYNVQVGGQTGWMASGWFRPGDCNSAVSGGETPTIIDSPTDDWGNTWEDPATHFGVDISSVTGNNSLHAPYAGTVVAQDACAACVDEQHPDGNRQGQHNAEYNYGYGSMIIVEYRYEDLREEDLRELAEDGVEIGEGESLYMMVAHLDPSQTVSETGSEVQP
ncbi:MAG: SH3 domain-containing protein, partial [Chloroflexota bacterium]